MSRDIRPTSLDHVALWVDERASLAAFLCDHLGMHVIEETDTFTLVGVDAKLGKLTLFDAEGPRERGALERIALRVGTPTRCPPATSRRRRRGELRGARRGAARARRAPRRGLRPRPRGAAPARPRRRSRRARGDGLRAPQRGAGRGDRELRVVEGGAPEGERPLLNHLALLVDSAGDVQRDAEARGVEIDDVKDAPNTFAVFLRGPSGVRIEYVEHKPGFALV